MSTIYNATVDEVEVLRKLSGPDLTVRELRVVRWAILDGQELTPRRIGETYRLVAEPFSAQTQLAPFYLADRLPSAPDLTRLFDLGATATP